MSPTINHKKRRRYPCSRRNRLDPIRLVFFRLPTGRNFSSSPLHFLRSKSLRPPPFSFTNYHHFAITTTALYSVVAAYPIRGLLRVTSSWVEGILTLLSVGLPCRYHRQAVGFACLSFVGFSCTLWALWLCRTSASSKLLNYPSAFAFGILRLVGSRSSLWVEVVAAHILFEHSKCSVGFWVA